MNCSRWIGVLVGDWVEVLVGGRLDRRVELLSELPVGWGSVGEESEEGMGSSKGMGSSGSSKGTGERWVISLSGVWAEIAAPVLPGSTLELMQSGGGVCLTGRGAPRVVAIMERVTGGSKGLRRCGK